MNEKQTVIAARARADEIIQKATGDAKAAVAKIAADAGLPDNIQGLSAGEFLGRCCYVPSMSRDLRSAGAEYLAKDTLRQIFTEAPGSSVEERAEQAGLPGADPDAKPANDDIDVGDLPLNPTTVKALKRAGVHTVRDVGKFTDEALLNLPGIAMPSLQRIRTECSKVSP